MKTPGNGFVELLGSEIGVHFRADGTLLRVAGRQYETVSVNNYPRFSALEAHRRALQRLTASQAIHPQPYDALPLGVRVYRDTNATLALLTSDGQHFQYVYRTAANDLRGRSYAVLINAESENIVAAFPDDVMNNCSPSLPIQSSFASGSPIRPGLGLRSLNANSAVRARGFQYEGVYPGSQNSLVFQEVGQTDRADFECDSSAPTSYTLFPVANDSVTPSYTNVDDTRGRWDGNAAGDALYKTVQTMNAFASMGRSSWNGAGAEAKIVVASTVMTPLCGTETCGTFRQSSEADKRVPDGGVVLITRGSQLYDLAASLDQVAHEWGHGVIYTSANFQNTPQWRQLHEGFADVVGQMVEKMVEPAGDGVEQSSDWDLGEDIAMNWGEYGFSGSQDDGSGHSFGPYSINLRFHDGDTLGASDDHGRGNMLNVAFYLLADGTRVLPYHQNPICTRLSLSGCGTNVPSLGFTKARRIFFDTIQWYLPSNADWPQLALYASAAAFDRYSDCRPYGTGYEATVEQDAVDKAFGAIGFPRLTPPDHC